MKQSPTPSFTESREEIVELQAFLRRMIQGLPLIVGLGALGLVAGAGLVLFLRAQRTPVYNLVVTIPVLKGEKTALYPDGSMFQPEDLRSPKIIEAAIHDAGLLDQGPSVSAASAALHVTGMVPPDLARERERLRNLGQPLPLLLPTEYSITFTPPAALKLSEEQSLRFLDTLVATYGRHFRSTSGRLPASMGRVFSDQLKDQDYASYGDILLAELAMLRSHLDANPLPSKVVSRQLAAEFASLELTLLPLTIDSLVTASATKDPASASVRLRGEFLRLEKRDQALQLEMEALTEVLNLQRAPTAANGAATIEADSFLLKKAFEVRLERKQIAARRALLAMQQDSMLHPEPAKTAAARASLVDLEAAYDRLVQHIKQALAQAAETPSMPAVTISQPAARVPVSPGLVKASLLGALLGASLGTALILLRTLLPSGSGR